MKTSDEGAEEHEQPNIADGIMSHGTSLSVENSANGSIRYSANCATSRTWVCLGDDKAPFHKRQSLS